MNGTIDEAARQMTDGSPSADFRRRVLARIEAGDAPRRSWRASFVLSPIAVAAAIVIAVMFVRRPAGPEGPALQTPPIAAAGPTNTPGPQGPAPQNAVAGKTAARPAVRRPGPLEPGLTAGPETPTLQIDPNNVGSIAVAPLAVDTLTPDSIQIPQLDAIAPITVAPLDLTDLQRRFE